MDLLQRLDELDKERFDIVLKLVPEVEQALKNLKFPPEVESVGWVQYYDEDNDFFVDNDIDSIYINGDIITNTEFAGRVNKIEYKREPITESWKPDINLRYHEGVGEFVASFLKIIEMYPNCVMKEAFGWSSLVVIDKRGEIEVSDYEHY